LMNSMDVGGYRNPDAANSRTGYWKPFAVIALNFYHKNGHYAKPNRVILKYPNFKKYVDPNAHVKVFNSAIKAITLHSVKASMSLEPTSLVGLAHKPFKRKMIP
jgi:hypothetical protein